LERGGGGFPYAWGLWMAQSRTGEVSKKATKATSKHPETGRSRQNQLSRVEPLVL